MYLFFPCFDLLLISVHLQVESGTPIVLSASIRFGISPPQLLWLQSCSLGFSWNAGRQTSQARCSGINIRLWTTWAAIFVASPSTVSGSLFLTGCRDAGCCETPRASADSINPPACGQIFKGNKGKSYLSSLWFHTERWRVPVSFCDSSVHVSCFSIRQTHDTEISSLIKATTNKAGGLSGYFRISPHVLQSYWKSWNQRVKSKQLTDIKFQRGIFWR